MKREEAKKLVPIIQAFADGKTIQLKVDGGGWKDTAEPQFLFSAENYRIKPEPRTFYSYRYRDSVGVNGLGRMFVTEQARNEFLSKPDTRLELFTVTEVL